ncbi:Acetyl esterase/lipase [Rhodococcus triatomae]|uniref:Acetyl esterase/lipase n=1 Tax=Rhodococcus triatomae TaxID=300028 RepID=A0A1G8KPC7_9NOCA|nr:Acetyl esterase/lipase [Rhodococcus triatomae]
MVGAALTANALRPLPGAPASVATFMSGWLTAELAPQLAVLTAVDAGQHLVRHGVKDTSTRVGLGLAAASVAGLGAVIGTGRGAGAVAERALEEELGPDYGAEAGGITRVGRPVWRQLSNPFRIRNEDVVRVRNLDYAPGGRRYRLDVYHRRDMPAGAPILLQIHGGGWVIGNKDQQGLPLMQEMASRGWVCVAINYPLAPRSKWPAHLIAAKRALAWLREHATEYGGDPEFVAVTGGSAGGHLASMVALTAGDSTLQPGFEEADTSVQACVPHYGVYDIAGDTGLEAVRQRRPLMRLVLGRSARYPDDYRAASPLARIHPDAPPFFVIHGRSDSLIPVAEARAFVGALREVSQRPVAYAELPGAQHAFDVFPSFRSIGVVQAVGRFLDWARQMPEPEQESVAERAELGDAGGR